MKGFFAILAAGFLLSGVVWFGWFFATPSQHLKPVYVSLGYIHLVVGFAFVACSGTFPRKW